MTSLVGVLCKEGVVIGTDSSATFGTGQFSTIEQPCEKIYIAGNRVVVAGTGQIGLGQRFSDIVTKALGNKLFDSHSALDIGRELTKQAIADFSYTGAIKGQYGALVAFATGAKPHLCEFAVSDFQPEMKNEKIWYVSMGSAQAITDPFLAFIRNVFWKSGLPSIHEAVFAVTWTLDHAIEINPGGVNGPVRVAVLESNNGKFHARLLQEEELGEHRQNIEAGKNLLRGLRLNQQPNGAESPPAIPSPG